MFRGAYKQDDEKIAGIIRILGLSLLAVHLWASGNGWGTSLLNHLMDPLMKTLARTGLFAHFVLAKIGSLFFLVVALGLSKKQYKGQPSPRTIATMTFSGLIFYFGSGILIPLKFSLSYTEWAYAIVTCAGYFMISKGLEMTFASIRTNRSSDTFNKIQETFPQEERLISNEFSINLPASYRLKDQTRRSWINIINPFRALLVIGSPGSGKSFFVIRHVIEQQIAKGFAAFIYDFKFDDLSVLTYNYLMIHRHRYARPPRFCLINFDDLSRSHRCNPLDPSLMVDITDAFESARTIMLGLNREWIRKQGDFWVESPIIFLTAIIWFLKKFKQGEFCTLPHVIELMQVEYNKLFSILRLVPEVDVLINPFITAFLNDAMEQLEGQVAGAKISMARLSSPQLYYIMTGNDFTLDINNPEEPKIVCAGNNPFKIQTHGAVLSLYVNRLIKVVNRKGGLKCSLIFDEFPTIYLSHIDHLIATARSNKVSTILAVQDQNQLRKDYGKDQADVIMNIVGNVICGQVTGETAEQLSRRFGKILQERVSQSDHEKGTVVSRSTQLDLAIPASTISSLSSGEFVGMVADDPDLKIPQKFFHATLQTGQPSIAGQSLPLPVIRHVTPAMVQENYTLIKKQVEILVESQLEKMMNTPEYLKLILRKRNSSAQRNSSS